MPRKKKTAEKSLNPHLSKGILAIFIVILAFIIALSFFDKAGVAGAFINEWGLNTLFGSAKYSVPFILLILAWFFVRNFDYSYKTTHGIGAFLFLVSLSSLFHIKLATEKMWLLALDGEGGGIFGMLAWPLKTYLGEIAGIVLLMGFLGISLVLLLNTSVTHIILFNKKILSGFGALGRLLLNGAGFLRKQKEIGEENGLVVRGEYEEEKDEDVDFSEKELNEVEEKTASRNFTQNNKNTKADDRTKRKVVIKEIPPLRLLNSKKGKPTSGDIKANAQTIQETLKDFNVDVDVGEVRVGPTVTQYSFKPAKGVKLSKILSLANNLSLALAAHPIRIEAPIPGKSLVGIEVPNQKTAMVNLRELLEAEEFRKRNHNMMIALGKDVGGKVWFADLPKMPHLLIAGATGSGKTVCMNTAIMSLLYQNTAETLRMIMVDPKRVELTLYNGIPHLLTPVITDTKQTVNALKWTISEMDRRFELLSKAENRDIGSYNSSHQNEKLPFIVFIVDELADLMATAASEVESGIIRLAQMARAVGIHLVLATQRPSVDVITGLMKANIPGRIAFSVASLIDSRTILDAPGAEKLLGRGDMLLQTAELSKPVRLQGAFISEEELKSVANYLKVDVEDIYDESILQKNGNGGTVNMFGGSNDSDDPLFEEAKELIVAAKKASASYLQRKMRIGYARAARLIDELEQAGVVGPQEGSKPRDVISQTGNNKTQNFEKTMDAGAEFNVFKDDLEDDFADEVNDEEELN